MTATAGAYRAPHCTQHGVDSTLNDCSACATLVNLAYATLGEYVTLPNGREMGKAALHAEVRRMRRSVNDTEGGLNIAQRQAIVAKAGFPAPKDVNVTFGEMKAGLKERKFTYSVGGNPSHIKGPSPLKRCDCAHEWAVTDYRVQNGVDQFLVYDPLRNASPLQRGEWRPASEVRQMAFKDSDGELNVVLAYPIGGWTQEQLLRSGTVRPLREQVEKLETSNNALRLRLDKTQDELDACQADKDCEEAMKAAREQMADSIRELLDTLTA